MRPRAPAPVAPRDAVSHFEELWARVRGEGPAGDLAAARELGRLEAGLPAVAAGTAAKTSAISKAPAPANHLNTGRTATRTDLASAGMDDYIRARKAQGARWAS